MPYLLSVGTWTPPFAVEQKDVLAFAREWFKNDFSDVDRLLSVFVNAEIERRHFSAPMDWFKKPRGFAEKNDLYVRTALEGGVASIHRCMENGCFLSEAVDPREIDALFFISSTGLAAPSLDARIINQLAFRSDIVRLPVWGLGCAGGTSGLSRADDFCRAYPEKAALVVAVELCSLTFQYNDRSKSHFIGTSLFADGAAAVLVAGDRSPLLKKSRRDVLPKTVASASWLVPRSEEVMGWDVRDDGLYVVFSKSIPELVKREFRPAAQKFLDAHGWQPEKLDYFIAHPGGKKVLDAYEQALGLEGESLQDARDVLRHFGNMSSPTVLFVLEKVMPKPSRPGVTGLSVSLGPGFSAEMLMLEWVNP